MAVALSLFTARARNLVIPDSSCKLFALKQSNLKLTNKKAGMEANPFRPFLLNQSAIGRGVFILNLAATRKGVRPECEREDGIRSVRRRRHC